MFYGWYIVTAGGILSAIVGGMIIYGFTAMVNPLATLFGWSYAQISLAMTFRGLEMGVLNPLVGFLADRWPARKLVLAGVIVTGAGLLCFSQISSLPLFYVSFLVIALGVSLSTNVVLMTVVARWFSSNVGKASSLLTVGIGLGGLMVPLVTMGIDAWGFQKSVMIMAAGVLAIGIPLSFVFRDRPEDYGLLPDGERVPRSPDTGNPVTIETGKGVKEALSTRAFWHIGIAFMLQAAGLSAVMLHIMPCLVSKEIARNTASIIAMVIPVLSIPMRFVFGWLSDMFRKSYVIAVSMTMTGCGLFLFSIVNGESWGLLIAFVIVYSTGLAGFSPLMPPIVREYFGTKKFGSIFGLAGFFLTVGGVIAPYIAGLVFDVRGTYDPMWSVLGGAAILGAVSILTLPRATTGMGRNTE